MPIPLYLRWSHLPMMARLLCHSVTTSDLLAKVAASLPPSEIADRDLPQPTSPHIHWAELDRCRTRCHQENDMAWHRFVNVLGDDKDDLSDACKKFAAASKAMNVIKISARSFSSHESRTFVETMPRQRGIPLCRGFSCAPAEINSRCRPFHRHPLSGGPHAYLSPSSR